MPSLNLQQQKILIILQKDLYCRIKEYYSQNINTIFLSRYINVLKDEYTDSCDIHFLRCLP